MQTNNSIYPQVSKEETDDTTCLSSGGWFMLLLLLLLQFVRHDSLTSIASHSVKFAANVQVNSEFFPIFPC